MILPSGHTDLGQFSLILNFFSSRFDDLRTNSRDELNKSMNSENALTVPLGFEPRVVGWKSQMNPIGYVLVRLSC